MKCKFCGSTNDDKNKFCIKCGSIIISAVITKESSHLVSASKHGHNIVKDRHKIIKHSLHKKTLNLKPLWVIGGIVIASILIVIAFDLIFHRYSDNAEYLVETQSSNSAIETQVTAIASKFICSCQTKECAGSSLETCTCGTAIKERQFIRTNLEKNIKPEDIKTALANKYGFLKSEVKNKYNNYPGRI